MIPALLAGGLCAMAALLLVRPFVAGHGQPAAAAAPRADGEAGRRLLRQIRDLDEDVRAGKLSEAEHAQQRRAIEARLVPILRAASDPPARSVGSGRGSAASPVGRRWPRRVVAVVVVGGLVASVGVLLRGAVEPRPTPPNAVSQAVAPAVPGTVPVGPTAGQLADVEAAVSQVREHPRSVTAHLALAHAYTAAGEPKLATVEYLATTRLDPGNPEANTALALVAFTSGNPRDAKTMVDRALRSRPRYPEALYVRGLVQAMGLKRPDAAKRDFEAYLEAAPFGAHRTTVQTLLAMVDQGGGR